MKYKAIGFDYSGVLAGISGPEFESRVTNFLQVALGTFQEVYFKYNYLLNTNRTSRDEFWKLILQELGMPEKYKSLFEFLDNLSSANKDIDQNMLGLILEMKLLGHKTGLLSNAPLSETGERKRLADFFDAIVISAEEGYIKPDPRIFRIFFERLEIKPQELIYIDDMKRNLDVAKELGCYPVLFVNYNLLIKELKKLGVIKKRTISSVG